MGGGLSELGRYSEPALLVLVSLSDGPKHGYAIMEDAEAIAGVRLGPGTLYGALSRLDRLGLIEPLPPEERRRPYRLSDAGLAVLRAELDALRRIADVGLRRLATA
ncbi:MAG TPA: helix-turn-helix transcriptional regulator [Chloroflexota bacterium]|nr:helix-turn-helix transcriptional regulator [Chloroflexota bacterium]